MRDVIMCVRAMLSDWAGIIRDLLTVKLFILSAKAIEWPLVFSLQNCNGTTRCLSDGPHQRGGGTREREGQCIVLLSIALLQVADALKQICSFLPSPLDLECEVMITVSSIKYNITPTTHHPPISHCRSTRMISSSSLSTSTWTPVTFARPSDCVPDLLTSPIYFYF